MQLPRLLEFFATRQYDAPCESVFRAWTDPLEFQRWFRPSQLIMNPVVDGLFWFEMDVGGAGVAHYGRYTCVDEPYRVEFTWMSLGTSGWETTVAIDILPVDGGGSEVRITHSGVPDDEMGRGHEEGWHNVLLALESAFVADPGEVA
jgi:uncharacterized protein YndB with AHSA1/START domain